MTFIFYCYFLLISIFIGLVTDFVTISSPAWSCVGPLLLIIRLRWPWLVFFIGFGCLHGIILGIKGIFSIIFTLCGFGCNLRRMCAEYRGNYIARKHHRRSLIHTNAALIFTLRCNKVRGCFRLIKFFLKMFHSLMRIIDSFKTQGNIIWSLFLIFNSYCARYFRSPPVIVVIL